MLGASIGLVEVKTDDLKRALSYVHKGELTAPLTIANLTRFGLQHCADPLLKLLRDVDAAGMRAVLVAVLAERKEAEEQRNRLHPPQSP